MSKAAPVNDNLRFAPTLVAHQLAFRFLSRAFYAAPTVELLDTLAGEQLFEDWPLESALPEMEQGLALVRAYCRRWSESDFPALRADYARLFVGPGHLLAAPWESVHRSIDHLMFDEQTLEVRKAYARFGLVSPKLNNEPDDHIGLELAFIAHLLAIAVERIESGGDVDEPLVAARDFLHEHLLAWSPEFLSLVAEHAATDYYRGLAALCGASLRELASLLDQLEAAG